MQPTNVNISTLFGNKIQFRIPLFQRHYVWELDDQWQPLWEDIEEKSNKRLSQPQRDEFSHFTGAIVIQQKPTNVDEVPKYEIIDGQQRLTTFQIILCTLRDICTSLMFKDIADEVGAYILNKGMLSEGYNGEHYKLVPTDFDKPALINIVEMSAAGNSGERIQEAYGYFQGMIQNYAEGDKEKILSLFYAVLNDFGFVQILIDSDDEPEMIFESLNGRGKSLLQFDLLRNNLFLRTRISEDDRDKLYKDYWSHFETGYWETKVKVGRKREILSELFFQHFLMAKLGEDSVSPLFTTYQRTYRKELTTENQSPKDELMELSRYSKTYKDITDCDMGSAVGLPMRFYKIFDITSLHPFVLYLVNDSGVSKADILLVLQALESYTLRRMLCTSQGHKNYNKFFSEEIRKHRKSGFDVRKFIQNLSSQSSDTSKWPANDEVKSALQGQWSGIGINRNVIRYILYRIELLNRGDNELTEKDDLPFNQQLTLEHILPEKWHESWQLPIGDGSLTYDELFPKEYEYRKTNRVRDSFIQLLISKEDLVDPSYWGAFKLARERDRLLQNIGNLTIVTHKLNASMSNAPYSKKRELLFSNSILMVNKEIYKSDSWDVAEIRQREQQLYEQFCAIWRDAASFENGIT